MFEYVVEHCDAACSASSPESPRGQKMDGTLSVNGVMMCIQIITT
jgi:hypothetical protein